MSWLTMSEYALRSLLSGGTQTWRMGDVETTIDLVLVSTELADEMVKCGVYHTNHRSDHQAIETEFDIVIPN